jgi:hypothetical protein
LQKQGSSRWLDNRFKGQGASHDDVQKQMLTAAGPHARRRRFTHTL